MANLLITTTPTLGNVEIQRYIGPLTANVVLGVNFFADFAASITDVFGGNSETYQSKLDNLTSEVDKIMQTKATRLGANAIIDYKLQFNEISGKGKQMFMVTATGTACLITMPNEAVIEEIGQISYAQIRRQYLLTLYRHRLNANETITSQDWENIFSLSIRELAPDLIKEYFRIKSVKSEEFNFVTYRDIFSGKLEEFLGCLDSAEIGQYIYSHLASFPELVVSLAIKYNLFDGKVVIDQITDGNLAIAIDLLRCHKAYYTLEDLKEMRTIIAMLDKLPNKGAFQIIKSGVFSKKEEEMFICPNGHKNPKDYKYCSSCDQDIKGLTSNQNGVIEHFKLLTDSLATLLH